MLQQVKWYLVSTIRMPIFLLSLLLLPFMFLLALAIALAEGSMRKSVIEMLALELRETVQAGWRWVIHHT